jgi:hypothetical protein
MNVNTCHAGSNRTGLSIDASHRSSHKRNSQNVFFYYSGTGG